MNCTLNICDTPVPSFEGDILHLQCYSKMLLEQAGQFVVVLGWDKLWILSEHAFPYLPHESIECFSPPVP